jgi:uncharacterized protein
MLRRCPPSGPPSIGRRLAPLSLAGLIGVPLGLWIVPWVSLATFKLSVGCLLVVYCTFMLFAAGRARLAVGGHGAEAGLGLASGILGGLAGLSGVLPTIWAALKGWPKDERRSLFQVFNTTILSAMLLVSLARGLIDLRFLTALAVALPGTMLGARLGSLLYRRLDDRRFDRIVLLLLLLSGLGLVWWNR